jgi:dTMP kinase
MKYKFITFEGIEGSGKSTQCKMLFDFLQKKNIDAILTREPGGVAASEQIRKILIDDNLEKLNPITEILLNFAARSEHVEKLIKPGLEQGRIVISDRFFDSTFAYQGAGFGVDEKLINDIKNIAISDFIPDITFLIDVSVEVAFARIKYRSTNNRYEKLGLEFHQKTREKFLDLASKNSRIKVIDGTKNKEEIFAEILELL